MNNESETHNRSDRAEQSDYAHQSMNASARFLQEVQSTPQASENKTKHAPLLNNFFMSIEPYPGLQTEYSSKEFNDKSNNSDNFRETKPSEALEKTGSSIVDDKTKPSDKPESKKLVTDKDVEDEAKKLNEMADKFLSGDTSAFQKFSDEINKIARGNDLDTIKKVFDKIAEENNGLNPVKDRVNVSYTKDGSLMLSMAPSMPSSLFLLNYHFISAIVSKDSAYTGATLGDWNHTELDTFNSW